MDDLGDVLGISFLLSLLAGRTEEGGTAEESGRNATAAEKAHGGEEVPEVAGSTQL